MLSTFKLGLFLVGARVVIIALIFASFFVSPAAADETWCWAPDAAAPRTSCTCTYTLAQCQLIVSLRRKWICVQAPETISDLPSSCEFGLESLVSKHHDP